jgi:hypothetical protein
MTLSIRRIFPGKSWEVNGIAVSTRHAVTLVKDPYVVGAHGSAKTKAHTYSKISDSATEKQHASVAQPDESFESFGIRSGAWAVLDNSVPRHRLS